MTRSARNVHRAVAAVAATAWVFRAVVRLRLLALISLIGLGLSGPALRVM